jgi:hypothetical protein
VGENLVDLVPSVLLAGDFDVCHDVVLLDGFLWMRNKKKKKIELHNQFLGV